MKKFSLLFFSFFICMVSLQAQLKVAVFDPIGDLPDATKVIIREKISGVISNSANYRAVERSLIEKVLEENKFQSKGLVDESQFTELGRKTGADLVCLSVVVNLDNDYYISCKLINYASSQVEKQRTAQIPASGSYIETAVQDLATRMFTGNLTAASRNTQSKIAIFEPEGNVGSNVKTIIREETGNVIVNNPNYVALERANIDRVLEENKFQGNFSNESEVRELGKMMGANYVCIITVVQSGSSYSIFCKQVDVETAIVEKQGEGKTPAIQDIAFAAKEAAMKFAANPDAIRKEIEKIKSENEKLRAQQQKEADDRQKADNKAAKRQANKGKNNYFSLGLGNGVTYGKMLGFGIAGRHGGIVGVGYEAGIGGGPDLGGSSDDTKYYFHYAAGLRFYPYKFIYLSACYGIIGTENISSDNSDDGFWALGGSKLLKGVSFLGGINYKFSGSALTVAAGLSYPDLDFGQKSRIAWNIAWSVAF
ncbi:MAG: CsgG/HfaB family protein [Dysgonamonadaceae bacterium]|nr:CsgG/HfaB family protein [Dysgonamonadaceae bacterium]